MLELHLARNSARRSSNAFGRHSGALSLAAESKAVLAMNTASCAPLHPPRDIRPLFERLDGDPARLPDWLNQPRDQSAPDAHEYISRENLRSLDMSFSRSSRCQQVNECSSICPSSLDDSAASRRPTLGCNTSTTPSRAAMAFSAASLPSTKTGSDAGADSASAQLCRVRFTWSLNVSYRALESVAISRSFDAQPCTLP